MNILQIVPELDVGGVEKGTVDIAKGLVQRGHKAYVISGGGKLIKELEGFGATHYTLPVGKKSLFTILKCIPQITKFLQHKKIDILHARSRVPAIIGFLASRKAKIPFITTCHGYYSKHPFSYVMGWGKFVIVPSNAIGRHMIEDFGVCPDNIRLIPRGVDLAKHPFKLRSEAKKDNFLLGIIGRITPIKGHDVFLKAAAKVIRLFPKTKVIIVGEPPKGKQKHLNNLRLLTRRLGISDNVEFLGTRYDIAELMPELDLVAMPSTSNEGFGRVIIEAGSAGVPVIGSRVGGIVDIIQDGKTGYLVPPQDVWALSEAMFKILKETKLTQTMCLAAREKIEQLFNLDRMVEETIKVYEEARKERILVIKLSSIGDIILASPSFRAIDKNYLDSHITALVGPQSRQIVQRLPYVDDCITYDRKTKGRTFSDFLKLARELWVRHFDMAIDLQNNKLSHWLCLLTGAPKRYGYDNGKWSHLLNYRLKDVKSRDNPLPPVEHQFRLLRFIGIEPNSANLEMPIRAEDEIKIRQLLDEEWVGKKQILVGINITGSLKWRTKRWALHKFAHLCNCLAGMGIRAVITGSVQELDYGHTLLKMTTSHPINAIGKTTIVELACLIKYCSAFITLDTAAMHIAASVGTPFIALFGPTDPRRHLPPNDNCIVIRKEVKCSPCYKRRCWHLRCMNELNVEEIVEAVKKLLTTDKHR